MDISALNDVLNSPGDEVDEGSLVSILKLKFGSECDEKIINNILLGLFNTASLRNFEIHRRMIILMSLIFHSVLKKKIEEDDSDDNHKHLAPLLSLQIPFNILFSVKQEENMEIQSGHVGIMFYSTSKLVGLRPEYDQLKNKIDTSGNRKYILKEYKRMRRLISFYSDLFIQLSMDYKKNEYPYQLIKDGNGKEQLCFSLEDYVSKSDAFTAWIIDINDIASSLLCTHDPSFSTCIEYKDYFGGVSHFIKLGGEKSRVESRNNSDASKDHDHDKFYDALTFEDDNIHNNGAPETTTEQHHLSLSLKETNPNVVLLPVFIPEDQERESSSKYSLTFKKLWSYLKSSTLSLSSSLSSPTTLYTRKRRIDEKRRNDSDDPTSNKKRRIEDGFTDNKNVTQDSVISENDGNDDIDFGSHNDDSQSENSTTNDGGGNKLDDPNNCTLDYVHDDFGMLCHAYRPSMADIKGITNAAELTEWTAGRKNTVVGTAINSIKEAMRTASEALVNCFDDKICSLDKDNKLCYVNRPEGYEKLEIEQHTIEDANGIYLGDVITVNGYFLDKILLEKITEQLNSIPMHDYGEVLGSNKGTKFKRLFGYYSNKKHTCYGYRNDKILIEALPMQPFLQIILDVMNEKLLEPIYEMLKSKHVHVFNHTMEDIQIMISKDGSGFGLHTDASNTTCRAHEDTIKCKDPKIPYVSEMVVATMVLVVDEFNMIVVDKDLSTQLEYTDSKDSKTKSLETIEMKGILFHAQYMNLQATSFHRITNKGKWQVGWRRVVFSARLSTENSTATNNKPIKRYKNCLNGMLNDKKTKIIEVENDTVSNDGEEKKIITKENINSSKSKMYFDYVKSSLLHTDSPSMLLIERPTLLVKCDHDWLRSQQCYMLLVEAGRALRFTDNKNSENNVCYFNGGYSIGQHYNSSTIRNNFDLSAGDGRATTGVFHKKFERLQVLALHTQYRNQMDIDYAVGVFQAREKTDGNANDFINNHSGYETGSGMFLRVGPRGGSYCNPAAFNNNDNAGSCVRNTANACRPCTELQKAVDKYTVLHLFIPLQWVLDRIKRPHIKESTDQLLYIGPVVGSTYYMLDPDRANPTPNYFIKDNLNYGSWSTTRNMVFEFVPVFNSTNKITDRITENISKMNDPNNDFIYNSEPIVKEIPRDDLDLSTEAHVKDRAPKAVTKEWLSQVLNDPTEETNELSLISNASLNIYSIPEAISQMIYNTVGSFCRVLDISSTGNGLAYIPIKSLSMVNGMYGIPSCIRTYNIPLFLILSNILIPAENTPHYIRMERQTITNDSSLVYMFLALIIVRTTGKPILFSLFNEFIEEKKKESPLQSKQNVHLKKHKFALPSTEDDFILFLEFLQDISNEESTIKTYVSVLYDGCLLSCSKGTIRAYQLFLSNTKNALSQWITEKAPARMFVEKGMQYDFCVASLRDILVKHGNNEETGSTQDQREKQRFLAAVIIADFDELYIDAFSKTATSSTVAGGPYLVHGLNLCYNVSTTSKVEIKARLDEIHKKFTASLLKLSRHVLAAMGLEQSNKMILVSINKRPFSVVDTEHILCKLVIPTRLTGCGYLGTKQIKLHIRDYEFPLGLDTEQLHPFSVVAKLSLQSFFHPDTVIANKMVSHTTRFPISKQWCEDKSWKNAVTDLLERFPKHPIVDLFNELELSQHIEWSDT